MSNVMSRIVALSAVVAVGAIAPALAAGPPAGTPTGSSNANPGKAHQHQTPGPNASPKAKRHAYGKYCSDQSKKHVAGEKGTAFSRCVNAMAKLASGDATSPRDACKTESKKHVAGEKGTPFSRCVSAAAKLRDDQDQADPTPTPESTPES